MLSADVNTLWSSDVNTHARFHTTVLMWISKVYQVLVSWSRKALFGVHAQVSCKKLNIVKTPGSPGDTCSCFPADPTNY